MLSQHRIGEGYLVGAVGVTLTTIFKVSFLLGYAKLGLACAEICSPPPGGEREVAERLQEPVCGPINQLVA